MNRILDDTLPRESDRSRCAFGTDRLTHALGSRSGFTLVELLVVIAIVGVLVGMSLPAIQNMREMSRRSNCQHNLMQLSMAISSYYAQNGYFPAGTRNPTGPIVNQAEGYHQDWISGLLPMMDAGNVFNAIDFKYGVYAPENAMPRQVRLPKLICPSASDIRDYTTCYAGFHSSIETPIDESNDGVFILNRNLDDRDISDGLSHTLFVGEKLSPFDEDLGWMSGTRSSLRNAGHAINAERVRVHGPYDDVEDVLPEYVGGIASDHPGGAYLMFGDGAIEFRSASMDMIVFQQMAARSDGAIPAEWQSSQEAAEVISEPASNAEEGEASDDSSDESD